MNAPARIACMGGRCPIRETCAAYHLDGVARLRPAERLCRGNADHWRPLFVQPRPIPLATPQEAR